ncbi:G1/S-specific cyclin-D2 [Chironomus tepperi]|uniref:G1/S-specific cyclin-D2 n=1 Tax=Chironomus tepperi TaxID=113505 RepID=UPI00391F6909
MDLSCNETMINDENEYNLYVEYQSDEKPATSAGGIQQQQQPTVQAQLGSIGIGKLYSNACTDPTFLRDRCLKNLLTSQKRYKTPSCSYFTNIQKTLTPQMRKIVAEWVIELCEERECQEEVPILAINYMDRVLNKLPISKNNLQLLAATCTFLASKLREPSTHALQPEVLIYYTDNSITKRDLMDTELLVLGCLKWDVSCVTPLDFIDLIISRLPIINKNCNDIDPEKIRKHAQAFISLAVREHDFSIYSASNIAASSIAASLSGLNWHSKSRISIYDLVDKLAELSESDSKFIISCMNKMEQLFQEQRRNLLNMMMLAKQGGLPASINKVESMKQPLKEQNKQQPKRNQETTKNKKKKQKSSSHVEDVNF